MVTRSDATHRVLDRLVVAHDRRRSSPTESELARLTQLEPAEVRDALAELARIGKAQRDVVELDGKVAVTWSLRPAAQAAGAARDGDRSRRGTPCW